MTASPELPLYYLMATQGGARFGCFLPANEWTHLSKIANNGDPFVLTLETATGVSTFVGVPRNGGFSMDISLAVGRDNGIHRGVFVHPSLPDSPLAEEVEGSELKDPRSYPQLLGKVSRVPWEGGPAAEAPAPASTAPAVNPEDKPSLSPKK